MLNKVYSAIRRLQRYFYFAISKITKKYIFAI